MSTHLERIYSDYYGRAGLPLHYSAHLGGATWSAILGYLRYIADPIYEREPPAHELRLVVGYCAYFINAPCWVLPERELTMLRASIEHVKSAHELATWLWGCGQIGIDPL